MPALPTELLFLPFLSAPKLRTPRPLFRRVSQKTGSTDRAAFRSDIHASRERCGRMGAGGALLLSKHTSPTAMRLGAHADASPNISHGVKNCFLPLFCGYVRSARSRARRSGPRCPH